MLYAYNIENGTRAILAVVNSPFKPHRRALMATSKPVFANWVEAFDVDVISGGCRLEFRLGDKDA